jgi:type I restriction enzyme S subunit
MGQSPPSSTYNEEGKGLPFFQGVKDFGRIYPSKRVYCTANTRKIAEADDVLLSVRAPVGEVNIASERCIIGRGVAVLRVKTRNKNDQRFLYYLMLFNQKFWRQIHSGTTFEEITSEDIENLEVFIPENILERHKIAEILGSLDDKIELNYEMNKTLEAIAQAIFKNWFVDFEPFKDELVYNEELGKEIPRGWEVRSISDFFKCRRGMSYRSIYLGKGNGLLFTLGVLRPDGGINYKEIKRYDERQIKEEYLIKPGDLLVGMTDLTAGTKMLGRPLLVPDLNNDKVSCVHHFCILRRRKDSYLTNGFFYFLFKQRHFKYMMNKIATGTTVRQINAERIAEYIFVVPPKEIVSKAQNIFDDVLKLSQFVEKENDILEKMRDALLLKLLSGEIRVKADVEKEFPEETKKLEEIGEEKIKLQESLDRWLK